MSRVFVCGVISVCLLADPGCLGPNVHAQPVFPNRALQPGATPPEVTKHHATVTERVLLIRDPKVVDHPDFDSDRSSAPANGPWSFASVIRRAFRQVGAKDQDVQAFMNAFRKQATEDMPVAMGLFERLWKQRSDSYAMEWAPMRLLAVVNRMDLAAVDPVGCQKDGQPGQLRGTEVRFVFAGLPAPDVPDYLSLIVEFVLPCMSKYEYQRFAKDWSGLETLDWSPPKWTYQTRLEQILSKWTSESKSVRIRINAKTTSPTWNVREFAFKGNGLVLTTLAREPRFKVFDCQTKDLLLGKFVATTSASEIEASNYDLPDSLSIEKQTTVVVTNPPERPVLTLDSSVAPDAQRDDIRFSLSLNSCTGCHSVETNTEFHHVGQRTRNQASLLSAFLTGSPDCKSGGETSLVSYCTVSLPPSHPPNCGGPRKERHYNDLLRRHLLLHKVLSLNPKADDATWKKALDGLAATQSH